MTASVTPVVAVHMTAALIATALGPVAIWARQGKASREVLHRSFGYAWVTLMIVAALSAVFIRSTAKFSVAGFSPIHLLIPFALGNIIIAFVRLSQGRIAEHRLHMVLTYVGACVVAGLFTLLPGRYLGDLIWGAL